MLKRKIADRLFGKVNYRVRVEMQKMCLVPVEKIYIPLEFPCHLYGNIYTNKANRTAKGTKTKDGQQNLPSQNFK